MIQTDLEDLIKKTHLYKCIDCGKCVGSCRIAEFIDESFSPRVIIRKLNIGFELDEKMLEKCNMCKELNVNGTIIPASRPRCVESCRYKINFYGFVNLYRKQRPQNKL
ncbi:MAG: hypothetical protein HY929_06510 [Euryarchaeota archaeon]|nr:hypothetical protein [Euryarchaeota archaeon]